jgi:hypothetical protein
LRCESRAKVEGQEGHLKGRCGGRESEPIRRRSERVREYNTTHLSCMSTLMLLQADGAGECFEAAWMGAGVFLDSAA